MPKSPWSPVSTPAAVWTVRRQAEASVLANILLGGCKAAAVALSGSLAVVASLIESSLQLLSGFVVWRASQKTRRRFRYSYPQGRTRLEPVAIVVLAVVMATATVQMLVRSGGEATVALAQSAGSNRSVRNVGLQVECRCGDVGNCSVGVSELTPTVVALVGASVAVKAVLLIACLASSRTRGSHSGRILAVAHFNDIVCSSLALGSAAAARYLWPYLDPIGAAVIALFIAQSWIRILLHQIRLLTGRCADHKLLQLLIFASANHSPLITGVCSATAFHHGVQCLAEVSIQLAPDTPLRLAHDVAEKLQQRLEQIEGIERAFVHPHCGDRPCEHKVV
uniref:ZT_dimer domain-containing protein n=1 Tax=Macrostomum lignano TaxID=282301 RepID=A0A1I8GZ78_9PLAT